MNFRILKFKSYFHLGKRLVIDVKSEIIDGKGVSAPQKRREVFHFDGCVNKQNVLISNMVSKILYGFVIKSYDLFLPYFYKLISVFSVIIL